MAKGRRRRRRLQRVKHRVGVFKRKAAQKEGLFRKRDGLAVRGEQIALVRSHHCYAAS